MFNCYFKGYILYLIQTTIIYNTTKIKSISSFINKNPYLQGLSRNRIMDRNFTGHTNPLI